MSTLAHVITSPGRFRLGLVCYTRLMDGVFAVELVDIGKGFPGVIANHDVTMRVRSGTIHAIVGENGAGKSTLMKTLYGMHQPDQGTISVFGQEVHFKSPSDAIAAGVGMVHQHFMLADNLTVLENIILGAEPAERGVLKLTDAKRRLRELERSVGANVDLDALVADPRRRPTPACRDPQGALPRRQGADPRRADRRARAAGGRGAVRHPSTVGGRRRRRSSSSPTSSTKCWRSPTRSPSFVTAQQWRRSFLVKSIAARSAG